MHVHAHMCIQERVHICSLQGFLRSVSHVPQFTIHISFEKGSLIGLKRVQLDSLDG